MAAARSVNLSDATIKRIKDEIAQEMMKLTGKIKPNEQFETGKVVRQIDPRALALRRNILNRHMKKYMGVEGKAGDNPVNNLDQGPRNTISFQPVTIYKGGNNINRSLKQLKAKDINVSNEIDKAMLKQVRHKPSLLYGDPQQKDYDAKRVGSMQGLNSIARENYKDSKKSKIKKLDFVL